MVYVGLIEGYCYYCDENVFGGYGDRSLWDYLPKDQALKKYADYEIEEY